MLNYPLGEQPSKWLIKVHQAHITQDLREEARVEQVQDRVLHTPHVLIDGKPSIDSFGIEGARIIMR
jgi:hypothetical protein